MDCEADCSTCGSDGYQIMEDTIGSLETRTDYLHTNDKERHNLHQCYIDPSDDQPFWKLYARPVKVVKYNPVTYENDGSYKPEELREILNKECETTEVTSIKDILKIDDIDNLLDVLQSLYDLNYVLGLVVKHCKSMAKTKLTDAETEEALDGLYPSNIIHRHDGLRIIFVSLCNNCTSTIIYDSHEQCCMNDKKGAAEPTQTQWGVDEDLDEIWKVWD